MMLKVSRLRRFLSNQTSKRTSYMAIYTITLLAGIPAFLNLPTLLIREIGQPMVAVFGCFIFFGSGVALVGLVVNYAWTERIGVILLITALVMYGVMLLTLTSITVAIFLVSALIISLGQRYADIQVEGGGA